MTADPATQELEEFDTDLDIDFLSRISDLGPYGEFTPYDEIEVGRASRQLAWTITEDTIDVFCQMQDDYHEWYSVGSPFGGRVAPLMASSQVVRALYPYRVGGLFTGWEGEMHDVLRPGVPYIWQVQVGDKWIRNDREWVAMDATCHHPDGNLVLTTRRVHVLDFLRISERDSHDIVVAEPGAVSEVEPYSAMSVRKRVPEEWVRDLGAAPVTSACYGRADLPVGTELVPVSRQYTWRKARDHAQLMYCYLFGWPTWMASHSFHVHPEAAADKGLAKPNISGLDPTGTLLSSLMMNLGGAGWLQRGRFAHRIVRQIGIDDFVTAKGVVVGKVDEPDGVRLECEVWCENQRGERLVKGEASAVVPR